MNTLYSNMELLTPVEQMEFNANVRHLKIARSNISRINGNNGLGDLGKLSRAEKIALKQQKRIEKAARKALNRLMSKKERRRIAKQAKRAQKQLKRSGGTGFIGELNKPGAAVFPLSPIAEQFRLASVAGDFSSMNAIAPFGTKAWLPKTSLGKYRFSVENGRAIYIPWSDQDVDLFLAGPWLVRNPATGLAPLIHPRRTRAINFPKISMTYKKGQAKVARKYQATDSRHVYPIRPGNYIVGHGIKSTWVKIRTPVIIAGAIVAAVYLGPAVVAKIKAMGVEGAAATEAASGTVATTATTSAKIFAGAQQLTNYVNQARTVEAIVNGEMPPPPIGVTGDSFREWAFDVAKDEFMKETQRQMTAAEEAQLQREIAQMQTELERLIPANTPMQPSAGVPFAVQETMAKQKTDSAQLNQIITIAIPVGLAIFAFGG